MTENEVGTAFLKLESECIIRNAQGRVKSSLYEVNDMLLGFPALGILELDEDNKILVHEVRVDLYERRIRMNLKEGRTEWLN